MRKRQSGFTLVEIAIVLVIIGLLLGGVLKGQELINQAKIKNIVNDFNGVAAAVYAYQDRYKALPGDDGGANGRWGVSNGNANGVINVSETTNETRLFWLHLRRAGLITGDSASDAPPFNAFNGTTTIIPNAVGFTGLVLCTSTLSGKIAEAVDSQLDNGKPNSGSVQATALDSGTEANNIAVTGDTAYSDSGGKVYRICKQI